LGSTRHLLLLLLTLCLCGRALAVPQATITVGGSEQMVNGAWDQGPITVSFNSSTGAHYSETFSYGQFSSPAALASAMGALFTRDYYNFGLTAYGSGNTVTFYMKSLATFGPISITDSNISFTLSPSSAFASNNLVLKCSPTTVLVGYTIGCVATQPVGTTGNVAFTINGNAWTTVPVDGVGDAVATDGLQGVAAGTYTISATGSSSSNPVTTTVTVQNTSSAPPPTGVYYYSISNSSGGSGYDGAGNIRSYTDSVTGTWSNAGYSGYDGMNWLTGMSATSGPYSNQSLCWTYDSFGNRTASVSVSGATCPSASSITPTVSYSANNQVTWVQNTAPGGFGYDQSGNVTTDALNNYLYDAEGRICAVKQTVAGVTVMTQYLYDAEGNRVAKGTLTNWGAGCDTTQNGFQQTAEYILGQNGEPLTEMSISNGQSAWSHTNVYAAGALLATYDNLGLHFVLADWLGTKRVETDYAGNIEETCTSLPFGDGLSCTQTSLSTADDASQHHFTAKEHDPESGNDYFGARYYSSSMGRFMSPDPSGLDYADITNPQSLNLYSYVANNPMVYIDPSGLMRIVQNCQPTPDTSIPTTTVDVTVGDQATNTTTTGVTAHPDTCTASILYDPSDWLKSNKPESLPLSPVHYIAAPSNGQNKKNCGQILWDASATVGLDAASTFLGAIPGAGAGLVTAQVVVGLAGAANSAYHGDAKGTLVNAIGGAQLSAVVAGADTVGLTAAKTFGGSVARSLPWIGSAVSAYYFYQDATEALDKYQECKAGIGG